MKLQLTYPVAPAIINQDFNDRRMIKFYEDNGIQFLGHNGIDFMAKHGQPIYASHDGEAFYEVDTKQGHGVVLRTLEKYEYGSIECFFKTIYWHLIDTTKDTSYPKIVESYTDKSKPGLRVKRGDIIGYADSTGLSTGDHLHFGLKPVMFIGGAYINLEDNNGYYGAIDPKPYLFGYPSPELKIEPFTKTMMYGERSTDVKRLQKFLVELGYGDFTPTGFYGPLTRLAVFDFQQENIDLSPYERYLLRGKICGEKTIKALNSIISNSN